MNDQHIFDVMFLLALYLYEISVFFLAKFASNKFECSKNNYDVGFYSFFTVLEYQAKTTSHDTINI